MTQELIRQLFNTARNADSLQSFERVAAEILSASIADTADYKRMFEEAVSALAAIDNALGIDPDEAGGAAPILEAIERLRNDGECRSCVDDKCVTGPECVTLGRDAAPTPERADADTAGALSAEQEREQFEADYATVWNAALKNNGWNGDHVAGDVKDLREGDTYGEGRDYLNARWEGWQARAALSAPASMSAEPTCTCSSNPHYYNCPVTAHVRSMLAQSGECAQGIANPSDKQEADCHQTCSACWGEQGERWPCAKKAAAPLAQSAEQDRIDAERWRWLKKNDFWLPCSPSGTEAAIDAAIAKGASK
jgi:hypothetical protein